MIDHTPEIHADEITAEERKAYNDFRTRYDISRFTKLERSSFIYGYRAAKKPSLATVAWKHILPEDAEFFGGKSHQYLDHDEVEKNLKHFGGKVEPLFGEDK